MYQPSWALSTRISASIIPILTPRRIQPAGSNSTLVFLSKNAIDSRKFELVSPHLRTFVLTERRSFPRQCRAR